MNTSRYVTTYDDGPLVWIYPAVVLTLAIVASWGAA